MNSIYASPDYRDFVNGWIAAQPQQHGILSQMCQAMRCQNSHLTRVLAGKVHLTMDQAFRLSSYLKLTKTESAFFMKLVEYERAGDSQYRKMLQDEMTSSRREQENLSRRFQQDRLGSLEREMTYYSSWHWIATHYIVEISRYQKPEAIAERLGLNEAFVQRSLEILERYGLIKKHGDSWKLNSGSIHLPKSSPLNSTQHGNWRNRAVLKSQDLDNDGLHFTTVQTLSEQDFASLKQLFLETIDHYRRVAKPSSPEELICFSLDFFRV